MPFLTFQINELEWNIEESFPEMEIHPRDLKRLKNFIIMFLSLKPGERPSAELAMTHRFLSSGLFMPKTDPVWKKQGKKADPLFCIISIFLLLT